MQIGPSLSVLRALGSSPSTPAPSRLQHLAEVQDAAAGQAVAAAARSEAQPARTAYPHADAAAVTSNHSLEASERAPELSRPRVDILV